MRRALHGAGWALVAGLWLVAEVRDARSAGGPGFAARALGPLAGRVAEAQWARVQLALAAGEHELALARAESALALAPHDAAGWSFVARHLALHLGSAQREPDPARRLALLRAGLAVLERGARSGADAGELARERAALLFVHAEQDPDLPWPGGADALRAEARRALELSAGSAPPPARGR